MNRAAKLGLHFHTAYETEQADDYYQHLDPCETTCKCNSLYDWSDVVTVKNNSNE